MTTPPTKGASRRSAVPNRRWPRRAGALAVALLGFAIGGGYLALRTSLPTIAGTIVVAGLGAEVEVMRDAHGVPHILAATPDDAYFALGFVHAQDRLWQMELLRRLGAGRLSEILGARTIATDRFFRTLGIARVAEANVATLDRETRASLEAYAAGINAFLEDRRGLLPPEFVLLGAPAPAPWRPADSIIVLKLMSWRLSLNWHDELLRARLAERLGAGQIEELWPPYPDEGPAAVPATQARDLFERLPLDALARMPAGGQPGDGSNNWVVDGSRSETGKPLLANDTHLGLSAPGTFYFAHLGAPGLNVVGATLPGLPIVVLGRNDRIAWGFTNTGPDTQDLFIERADPGDDGRYLAPGGPRAFATRREVIAVDGAADVEFTVRESRHGPIVSDRLAGAAGVFEARESLALAWTGLRIDDPSARAGFKLTRARDWDEFVAAMRDNHGPQQNIVYADVDGNIGFYAPARVPIRKNGDGRAPVPGWTGDHDWIGFVPFAELPHALNPAAGRIVTANNKIVPAGYPYLIANDWAAPYRARRIAELIDARRHHSLASFRDIQADVFSPMARAMLPHAVGARPRTEAARAVRSLLAEWDGEMARDAPAPLIFSAWYRALTRLIYADELGPLFDAAWGLRPLFVRWVLDGGGERWCDDTATAAIESCAEISARALDLAAADLIERHGDNPRRWRWGEAHAARHDHGVFGDVPILGSWFGASLANGGGPFTVNAGRYAMADSERPFAQIHGPTFRAIYDLADLERSLFVLAVGQSGNPLSPYYRDQAERWRDHRPFAIQTRREAIAATVANRLALVPR